MRILLALFCSLALAFAASGAQQEKKKPAPTKRAAPAAHTSRPAGKPSQVQRATKPAKHTTTTARQAQVQRATKPAKHTTTTARQAQVQRATKPGKPTTTTARQAQVQRATKPGKPTTTTARQAQLQSATKPAKPATTQAGRAAVARNAAAKPFKAQRFNLATNTRPTKVASVNFQQGRRIQGSQNWQGGNYWAFRNYRSAWHDRGWWHNHYNRVVFVYGGWYAGTQAIGTRLGATHPIRITLTMARSMAITACRPIRWSPTFRPRCNSKAIIKAKWTACLGHLRARRLQLTRPNRAYTRPQPLISRHWNR